MHNDLLAKRCCNVQLAGQSLTVDWTANNACSPSYIPKGPTECFSGLEQWRCNLGPNFIKCIADNGSGHCGQLIYEVIKSPIMVPLRTPCDHLLPILS